MKKNTSFQILSLGFLLAASPLLSNSEEDWSLDIEYEYPESKDAIDIFSFKEEGNPFGEIVRKRTAESFDLFEGSPPLVGVKSPVVEDEELIAQAEPQPTSTANIEDQGGDVIIDTPNAEIIINPDEEGAHEDLPTPPKTILINFNNVSVVEYVRFISRFTNKNFIFDENDLDFKVTVISEEPTTLENVMTTLLQELRIHGLTMIEEGNNLIIHRSDDVSAISKVTTDETPSVMPRDNELVTHVFRLNTLDPAKAAAIIKPLVSKQALLEVSEDTRQVIVTDLVTNINQISQLLKGIDAPNSGVVIGQFVVRNAFVDSLIELTTQIMAPIAQDQAISMIPHPTTQSIFVVSTPFLVERTLSVMQHIDQKQVETKIFGLDDLKFQPIVPPAKPAITEAERAPTEGEPAEGPITPTQDVIDTGGRWEIDPDGKWIFRPGITDTTEAFPTDTTGAFPTVTTRAFPKGSWVLDPQDKWYFLPEGAEMPFDFKTDRQAGNAPIGNWGVDKEGKQVFQLAPGEPIKPEHLIRKIKRKDDLPIGHIERTKFLLLKLQNRSGEDVVEAIQNIGLSLEEVSVVNSDLLLSINSVQWIEPTNSLIITGTDGSIEKISELVKAIDQSIRQVFIEMLILETDIDDSLKYGVDWGTRSGGGSTSTAQAFLGGASQLSGTLFGGEGDSKPAAGSLAQAGGFTLGIIGQRLTHCGKQFADIGALIRFVHSDTRTNIIMNPKIITEDNKAAEIFVGINTPFQDESISNDEGSIITTNVEFRDVGTTLNVTPHIGNNNVVTLEIELENSSVGSQPSASGEDLQNISTTPTTRINRTNTTVHVPDGFFVIISGMIQEEIANTNNQVPCLGGIPILGGAFKAKERSDQKRNLMIFIRPVIVDTEQEFNDLTCQQQDIHRQKSRQKSDWKHHMDEALEFLNIRSECDPCEPCD